MSALLGVLVYKPCSPGLSTAEILERIAQIDLLTSTLLDEAMKSVLKSGIAEYELDTGQTKTRVKYNSTSSITTAVRGFMDLRKMYEIMLNGAGAGVVRLMDQSNFLG